jgi:hypothetical protein
MIFFKNTVSPESDKTIYFEAFEDEKLIGKCTMILEEKYANVCVLSFEAIYAGEGLLKSAYNYACLKNYYMGKCTVQNIDQLLLKLGFTQKDGAYENDIPSILMGSCGCKK